MPKVLTTNAQIFCPHGGKGISIPTDPKWSVNGGAVLLENDTGTLACPFLACPCVGYTLRSMGLNSTLVVGRKVILVTDFNTTLTGLPLILEEFHSTIDNSTPAPIPPGQPAPPLSLAMLDAAPPVVTPTPQTLAFNTSSGSPPTLTVTFSLVSAFPMQWFLTLINEPLKSHADMTNGLPPGLTIAPAGGGWNTSFLTITMTMTAAFMTSLTPGKHHFYMTGVSQRGLTGYTEVVLTVT